MNLAKCTVPVVQYIHVCDSTHPVNEQTDHESPFHSCIWCTSLEIFQLGIEFHCEHKHSFEVISQTVSPFNNAQRACDAARRMCHARAKTNYGHSSGLLKRGIYQKMDEGVREKQEKLVNKIIWKLSHIDFLWYSEKLFMGGNKYVSGPGHTLKISVSLHYK